MMHAYDIQQLKQQSPLLRESLQTHGQKVWHFLHHEVVDTSDLWESSCYHAYFRKDLSVTGPCARCGKMAHATLVSPYNAPHGGWCIDCILSAFFGPDTPRRDQEGCNATTEDEKQRQFWEEFYHPTLPEDYDGPPIWIA